MAQWPLLENFERLVARRLAIYCRFEHQLFNPGSKGQDFTQPVLSATGVTINSGCGVIVAGISLFGLFATTSQELADRE